jgi:REP element-mobilizing transposase RayT
MFPHQSWIPQLKAPRFQAFGGPLLKGNARKARPFSKRSPMLIVLKSEPKAQGRYDLLRYQVLIQKILFRLARRFKIKVIGYSQLNGRHIHFLIQSPNKNAQSHLLRAFSGLVARVVWSSERGRPATSIKSLWSQRPYSQILSWGSELSLWKRFVGRKGPQSLGTSFIFAGHSSADRESESLSNTS